MFFNLLILEAMSDLVICRLSDAAASVVGGREIILLCEKVTKGKIEIKIYFSNILMFSCIYY